MLLLQVGVPTATVPEDSNSLCKNIAHSLLPDPELFHRYLRIGPHMPVRKEAPVSSLRESCPLRNQRGTKKQTLKWQEL